MKHTSIRYRSMLVWLMVLAGWSVACDDVKTARTTTTKSSTWNNDHWTKVSPAQTQTGRIDPRYGRKARRISLQHLKTVIPRLFPKLNWTSGNDNMFTKLSRTLGQADYIYQTQSHRTATPLFMKFMDDMAGQLCKKAIEADKKNDKANTRMILRHERSPDQNLRYLRLKFHTIYVPEDSTEGIKALRTVYDKALAVTQDPHKAWHTVCVAMLSSPEFFAY